jgi:hypothetical protein
MTGNPSEGDYKGMVCGNMINKCPIITSDITNAKTILGSDLASVQGKNVHCTPAPMVADYVAVPCLLVERNRVITMDADVNSVDGTAFLVKLSRNIRLLQSIFL